MFDSVKEGVKKTQGKVLVIGNSITDDGRYITFLNCFFRIFHKEVDITFINLGVNSETVSGLSEPEHPFERPCVLSRITRIVDEFDATMAIICYGVNDAIYYPLEEDRTRRFIDGMECLIDKLKEKGIRVCLMTATPFDRVAFNGELRPIQEKIFSYLNPYEEYDQVMKAYASLEIEKFTGQVDVIIDLYTILSQDINIKKREDITYQSGDGIHPNLHGHFVIAKSILRELFHIHVEKEEDILSLENHCLFQLMEQKDYLLHSYYKERIGHDNPYKNEVISEQERREKLSQLEEEITNYINTFIDK